MEISQTRISTNAQAADLFLKQLLIEMSAKLIIPHIVVLARLGSWVRSERTEDSDYDLLLICDGTEIFLQVVSAIGEVQQRLVIETGVTVAIFPSFRIEELHRALAKKPCCLVHLLMYPSVSSFLCWEHSNVVRSICAGAQLIVGNNNLLVSIADNLPQPDEKTSIEDLSSLLYNSYMYLANGQMANEEVSIKEGFHKLQYAVRHMTAIALQNIGINAFSWESVVNQHGRLGLGSSCVVDNVFEIRTVSKTSDGALLTSKKALMELYQKAFLYLADISERASFVEK